MHRKRLKFESEANVQFLGRLEIIELGDEQKIRNPAFGKAKKS